MAGGPREELPWGPSIKSDPRWLPMEDIFPDLPGGIPITSHFLVISSPNREHIAFYQINIIIGC